MTLSAPELISETHDVSQFTCGKPALDHWLKTHALANQRKGFTVVLVVHQVGRVVGYYGLAPTAVVPSMLPRSIRTGQRLTTASENRDGFPPEMDGMPFLLMGCRWRRSKNAPLTQIYLITSMRCRSAVPLLLSYPPPE